MSVRRFNLQTNAYSGLSGSALSAQSQIVEAHQGKYVLADDYYRLKATADADAAVLQRCRAAMDQFEQSATVLKQDKWFTPEKTWSLQATILFAKELRKALAGNL